MNFILAIGTKKSITSNNFKGEKISQVHDEYIYQGTPPRTQDYLSKVQQLIK